MSCELKVSILRQSIIKVPFVYQYRSKLQNQKKFPPKGGETVLTQCVKEIEWMFETYFLISHNKL